MRIAQIVLPDASQYERKSQRVDAAALAEKHEVLSASLETIGQMDADVAHVYAGSELPASAFLRFPMPYLASAGVRMGRWSWRKPLQPRQVVSPLGDEPLPEAVEDCYFAPLPPRGGHDKIVGSFARSSTRNMVEQTMTRIHRFRGDVAWQLYEQPPSPEDLAGVDVWVDPAVDPEDFDGFTAEALVVGLPVVAARTPINVLRLEQGRTGFLVPPRDPNEFTHAILAALFKPERSQVKQHAATQTVSKFRARQRLRMLTRLYEVSKTP